MTKFGKVEIGETHAYSAATHGFRISPLLQALLTYVGASEIYSDGNELIEKFLNIEINAMQIHRVTNTHGNSMVAGVSATDAKALKAALKPDEVVYAMVDGAMILTREDGWKEVKTGRVFGASALVEMSASRRELAHSLYVSHLGSKDDFIEKFEKVADVFEPLGAGLVIVTDGAKWISNWVATDYPKATCILDLFHLLEHLNAWLLLQYKDTDARKLAFATYKTLVLSGGGSALHAAISEVIDGSKTAATERLALLNYLENNLFRMDYPAYIARGLQCGSGAIESAQRTVLQQRLKLSGQRWTQEKAQNVLNLRVVRLSKQWHKVTNHIRNIKIAV
jgi:hypothetical protein